MKQAGIVIAAGNVFYTVASIVFVLAGVFPLTTTGVVLTLATGVYTLVMAELQYQGVRRIKSVSLPRADVKTPKMTIFGEFVSSLWRAVALYSLRRRSRLIA